MTKKKKALIIVGAIILAIALIHLPKIALGMTQKILLLDQLYYVMTQVNRLQQSSQTVTSALLGMMQRAFLIRYRFLKDLRTKRNFCARFLHSSNTICRHFPYGSQTRKHPQYVALQQTCIVLTGYVAFLLPTAMGVRQLKTKHLRLNGLNKKQKN